MNLLNLFESNEPGFQALDAWKQQVLQAYPEHAGKIKFLGRDNQVSAEVPGMDRSFGVFDLDTEQGQVLDEAGYRNYNDNRTGFGRRTRDMSDEANMMYRYDPADGKLKQRMVGNPERQQAMASGFRDTHEQALKLHKIIRSKFDANKFVQKQGDKWIPVNPYSNQGVSEEWSQKYKSSINCSHPKGFSQKAHCAGKRKHNESMEMESVCPDCGMCETHGDNMMEVKQRLDAKCWKGKHKEGTKIKGGIRVNNCVPNESAFDNYSPIAQQQIAKDREQSLHNTGAMEVIHDLINGSLDGYDVMNHPRTPAQKVVAKMMQDKYDDIAINHRLHGDDDFEEIISRIIDDFEEDYGQQGVAEAGPFSYGAKPPRKGSVAYNDLMKRKEQDRKRVKDIEAIGTKNHHVGVAKVTKDVSEGLNEMDKSAPQPGRDGRVSHSTYGSRDKKGSDYFKGKEVPGKPVTKKQMEKDALNILKKQGVAEGVATTVPELDAKKYLRKYGADHFQTTTNELHFYKNGKPFSVDLVLNPDTSRSVTISSLNAARRGLTGQGVAEGSLDPSGLIAAASMVRNFIVTAEVDGKVKKFRIRGMTGPNAAKERFLKHHSMAKILDVKQVDTNMSEADMGRRGFLGTMGKAAAAGAAMAAGGNALAQQKQSVNISTDEADAQIKQLRSQAYKDLASLMWNVWPYILDKNFGSRTAQDAIPTAEEIGQLISNRIGRQLEEYAKEYRKKVYLIKVNAGVTDPGTLNKTSAMLESMVEQEPESGFGAEGSRKLGTVNTELMSRAWRENRPYVVLTFGNSGEYRLDRGMIRYLLNYYKALPDDNSKWYFIYETMSRLEKLVALLDKANLPNSDIPPPGQQELDLTEKKRSEDDLSAVGARDADVQRALQRARAATPTAKSDIGALVKQDLKTQEKTQQKLDDIDAENQRQMDMLKKADSVNNDQQRAIRNLERQVAKVSATPVTPKAEPAPTPKKSAEAPTVPAVEPARIPPMARPRATVGDKAPAGVKIPSLKTPRRKPIKLPEPVAMQEPTKLQIPAPAQGQQTVLPSLTPQPVPQYNKADAVDVDFRHLGAAPNLDNFDVEEPQQRTGTYGEGIAETADDIVKFSVDGERAYDAVMKRFGDVIDWSDDSMTIPRKLWPRVEELAHDFGGEASEDYMI